MNAAVLIVTALVLFATRVDSCPCTLCGPEIKVTLCIQNNLTTPFFNETTMITMCQRELIFFLEEAASQNTTFGFSANYTEYGYFIITINNVTAYSTSDYWKITDGYNNTINKGVSSYVPSNNEKIIFRLTKIT